MPQFGDGWVPSKRTLCDCHSRHMQQLSICKLSLPGSRYAVAVHADNGTFTRANDYGRCATRRHVKIDRCNSNRWRKKKMWRGKEEHFDRAHPSQMWYHAQIASARAWWKIVSFEIFIHKKSIRRGSLIHCIILSHYLGIIFHSVIPPNLFDILPRERESTPGESSLLFLSFSLSFSPSFVRSTRSLR